MHSGNMALTDIASDSTTELSKVLHRAERMQSDFKPCSTCCPSWAQTRRGTGWHRGSRPYTTEAIEMTCTLLIREVMAYYVEKCGFVASGCALNVTLEVGRCAHQLVNCQSNGDIHGFVDLARFGSQG